MSPEMKLSSNIMYRCSKDSNSDIDEPDLKRLYWLFKKPNWQIQVLFFLLLSPLLYRVYQLLVTIACAVCFGSGTCKIYTLVHATPAMNLFPYEPGWKEYTLVAAILVFTYTTCFVCVVKWTQQRMIKNIRFCCGRKLKLSVLQENIQTAIKMILTPTLNIHTLLMAFHLLMQCGDIESNPGPTGSMEYEIIVSCSTKIVSALCRESNDLALLMLENWLISAEQWRNVTTTQKSECDKANHLFEALMDAVKFDSKHYYTFKTILRDPKLLGNQLLDDLERVESSYCKRLSSDSALETAFQQRIDSRINNEWSRTLCQMETKKICVDKVTRFLIHRHKKCAEILNTEGLTIRIIFEKLSSSQLWSFEKYELLESIVMQTSSDLRPILDDYIFKYRGHILAVKIIAKLPSLQQDNASSDSSSFTHGIATQLAKYLQIPWTITEVSANYVKELWDDGRCYFSNLRPLTMVAKLILHSCSSSQEITATEAVLLPSCEETKFEHQSDLRLEAETVHVQVEDSNQFEDDHPTLTVNKPISGSGKRSHNAAFSESTDEDSDIIEKAKRKQPEEISSHSLELSTVVEHKPLHVGTEPEDTNESSEVLSVTTFSAEDTHGSQIVVKPEASEGPVITEALLSTKSSTETESTIHMMSTPASERKLKRESDIKKTSTIDITCKTNIIDCTKRFGGRLPNRNSNDGPISKAFKKKNVSRKLLAACRSKTPNINKIKGYLEQEDCDVNIREGDAFKWNPLMWCCERKHFEISRLLLKYHPEVNIQDKKEWTPLVLASRAGDLEIVQGIVELGAEIDKPTNRLWTPLMWAAHEGHASVAEFLLKNGAQVEFPDLNGYTPLMQASQEGHADVVNVLLRYNAYPNHQTNNTWSALMEAARSRHSEVVDALLKGGAESELARDDGSTALHVASYYRGNSAAVNALINHGAKLDHQNKDGLTPLMLATTRGNLNIVQTLIERGADIDKPHPETEWTAIFFAAKSGNLATFKDLLYKGSKTETEGAKLTDVASLFRKKAILSELEKFEESRHRQISSHVLTLEPSPPTVAEVEQETPTVATPPENTKPLQDSAVTTSSVSNSIATAVKVKPEEATNVQGLVTIETQKETKTKTDTKTKAEEVSTTNTPKEVKVRQYSDVKADIKRKADIIDLILRGFDHRMTGKSVKEGEFTNKQHGRPGKGVQSAVLITHRDTPSPVVQNHYVRVEPDDDLFS